MKPARSNIRGKTVTIHYIDANAPVKQPSMLFDVLPEVATMDTGDGTGLLTNVPMLQAGVSSVDSPSRAVSGILYLPEVGSRVLCVFDGFRWVIAGFYTGPVSTIAETTADPDKRHLSFNPGIEMAFGRGDAAPGADQIPDWAFSIEPGDAVMSKGTSKVKACAAGVVIGSDLTAMDMYLRDGKVVRRSLSEEQRTPGYYRRLDWEIGNREAASAPTAGSERTVPRSNGRTFEFEIIETSPYDEELKPYVLQSRGHVASDIALYGRAAPRVLDQAQYLTSVQNLARGYSVRRTTVVQPLSPQRSQAQPFYEIAVGLGSAAQGAPIYDHWVGADGSWSVKAGNVTRTPGDPLATPAKTGSGNPLESEVSYDAKLQAFTVAIWKGQTRLAKLSLNAAGATLDSALDTVVKADGDTTVFAVKSATVWGAANVSLRSGAFQFSLDAAGVATLLATQLNLQGMNAVLSGNLTVGGAILAARMTTPNGSI